MTPDVARGETAPDRESVVRTASRKIAIRSSTIRIPNTSSLTRPFTLCSSNAFAMIVVLEIAIIAPAKMLSSVVQPSSCPTTIPEPDHDAALEHRDRAGRRADLDELSEAELEPEREHQQDHAELGERVHRVAFGDERDRDVRPDDQPGEQVAEHDRLVQALEHDRRDCRHAQHDREVLEKQVRVHWQNLLATGERKNKRLPFQAAFSILTKTGLLFPLPIIEGESIRFADSVEHGVDRDCNPPIVQRGLVARAPLKPARHAWRGFRSGRSNRLFVRGVIRTIHVHSTSNG